MPVTTVAAGPCFITAIENYSGGKRIQLGFGIKRHIGKVREGIMKKAGLTQKLRFLRSLTIKDSPDGNKYSVGSQLTVSDVFTPDDTIRVTGISKGKGFAGVVRRHHFKGGPRTHGQSDRERAPGSIGMTTTPGRVYRGKRMAGRMGNCRVTVKGLRVVSVDPTKHTMEITGVLPGPTGGLLIIQKEA